MSECVIVVRNADGTLRGELAECASFTGGPRANEVGTAQVTFDWKHPLLHGLLTSRSELAVLRASDGFELFGGPVDENSLRLDGSAGTATLTVKEQTQWLNWRLLVSSMADQTDGGTSDPYDDDIGGLQFVEAYGDRWVGVDNIQSDLYYPGPDVLVSTVVWNLVNYAVGPWAHPLRQVPSFTVGPDPHIGPPISQQFTFAAGYVGAMVNELAQRHGLILAMIDGQYTIRSPADLSDTVVFETEQADLRALTPTQTHSLLGYDYRLAPPAATVAWTASDYDGGNINRVIILAFDETLLARWGWIEVFDDENTKAYPIGLPAIEALQAEGEAFLAALQGPESLSMTTLEGPMYGVDYQLGDIVGARLTPDLVYAGPVTGLDITADPDGWRLTPALGDRILLKDLRLVPKVNDLLTRVGRLEGA